MEQESTEDDILLFIKNSKAITDILKAHDININKVCDYSMYPIADNATPLLSADRLEYTLGNGYIVHNMGLEYVKSIYDDLIVVKNDENVDELCFKSITLARQFVDLSLKNSYWFVSNEDRFSMQYLADLIREAVDNNVIEYDDLFTTERVVISKLKSNPQTSENWDNYTKISSVSTLPKKDPSIYCVNIPAKKRYINPLILVDENKIEICDDKVDSEVLSEGALREGTKGNKIKRITEIDETYKEKINKFLSLDFNIWIHAKETPSQY